MGLQSGDARKALRKFWEYRLPLAGDEVAALAMDTPRDSGMLDTSFAKALSRRS